LGLNIAELMNPEELARQMELGYVGKQSHPDPTLGLQILNYTKKCQYDRAWNDVTRQCRGLILHKHTGEVIARPWPKFHNYEEHDTTDWDPEEPCWVTDKLDGSMGILYPKEDEYGVATRGSFTSDQAIRATQIYEERYADWMPDILNITYLYEIIFPANRVVVDYGDDEDIVLLGGVSISTGEILQAQSLGWPGRVVDNFGYMTVRDALELEPRSNVEGVVLQLAERAEGSLLVKIKQADYVALHRIITGLNEKHIWERLVVEACHPYVPDPKFWGTFLGIDPKDAEQYLATKSEWRESIPEEFNEWIEGVIRGIDEKREALMADTLFLINQVREIPERKVQYELVKHHPCATEIMRYINSDSDDATQLTMRVWRLVKPEVSVAAFDRAEDVA
jgi:RNA ligase